MGLDYEIENNHSIVSVCRYEIKNCYVIDRFILLFFLQFWVKKKIKPCNDINIGIYVFELNKKNKGEKQAFFAIFNRKFMV